MGEPEEWKFDPAKDQGLTRRQRERSLKREAGLVSTLSAALWGAATRSYLRAYHRLVIEGRENLPEPPFVLVGNHASHLDAIVLAAAVPFGRLDRVFPIAAGDTFFERPLLSAFAASCLNALPIWRKHCGGHSLEELRTRLLEDRCIFILFPEGTRTRNGETGSFKPGIGKIVCDTPVPVVPCFLKGAGAALPVGKRFPRPVQIRLLIGRPIGFADVSNAREGWVQSAGMLRDAVVSLDNEDSCEE